MALRVKFINRFFLLDKRGLADNMKFRLMFLAVSALVLALLLSNALAFEIKPFKQDYLVGETFQAEIIGNFSKDLTLDSVHIFKDNVEQFPAFSFIKISGKQYFIYFDLQSAGNYSLQVKNALYYENGILKGETKKADFFVEKSLASEYLSLINSVKQEWPSSVEENAYALLALSYDTELAKQGKQELVGKGDSEKQCWPASGCKVKDTSLALLALSKLGSVDSKWLVDSQNNLDIGLYDIILDAKADSSCILNTTKEQKTVFVASGINTINLDLKNKPSQVNVSISCTSDFDAKIVHTYLGILSEFKMNKQGNMSSFVLNNSKCYGRFYKDVCNTEASAYAYFVLSDLKLDTKGLLDWLKINAVSTKEKAITKSFEDWLVNNQHNRGYWSNSSLAVSQVPDIESTIFASWSLQGKDAGVRGKEWLKGNFDSFNFKNRALALALLFPSSGIESVVSINPAFIKPSKNVELSVINNGIKVINVSAKFLLTNEVKEIILESGKSSKVSFVISNASITSSSIEISYPEKFGSSSELQYTIPVLITLIHENTTIPLQEETTPRFRFIPESLNITLNITEFTLKIYLKNLAPYSIKNLSFEVTRDFAKILKIQPENFSEISGGKIVQVNLLFSAKEDEYSGEIEGISGNVSVKLPLNLTVKKNAPQNDVPGGSIIFENKTCSALNGTVCKLDEKCSGQLKPAMGTSFCCIGKCSKQTGTKRNIGVILIAVAGLILVIFLANRFKKKKPKEMKDVVQKIEEKYIPKTEHPGTKFK
ncbi:hypothetical protein HZA33_02215 [Candidatus Pacearchaeota archaeon]|nr:hypothetical protein [Candidatus Pacearchaeota archaeon]